MRRDRIIKICFSCGRVFERSRSRMRQLQRAFCSRACSKAIENWYIPEPNSGCWLWLGAPTDKGYARIWVKGRASAAQAHRVMYEKLKGPVPEGLELDHKCRTPCCINPDHLEPVTHRENVVRGMRIVRARQSLTCRNGHPWTPQNTYAHPRSGSRVCRRCTAAAQAAYHQRKLECRTTSA